MKTNDLLLNLYALGAILSFIFIGLSLIPSIGVMDKFRKALGCFTKRFKDPLMENFMNFVILGACVVSSWIFVFVFIIWNISTYIIEETNIIANRTNVPLPHGYNKIIVFEGVKGDPDPKELAEFLSENLFEEDIKYLETIKVLKYRKDIFFALPEREGRDLTEKLPDFFRYLSEINENGTIGIYPERVKDYLTYEYVL